MTDLRTLDGVGPPPTSMLLTFLIADVRGYTHFSAERGDAAAMRLSEQFLALCREVVEAHGGHVFGSAGDQAVAAFSSAHAALRAALSLQQRLSEEQELHPDLPLQAGIGLDTGEGVRIGNDYRGNAINLAARLCSIAGAGEIFAADTVIMVAHVMGGITVVDRGEVRLKGLLNPVRVVQIAPEGELPEELPPLQSILVTQPTNLPDEPTPFIGRELEIAAIVARLRDPHVRLVTLTGPGGTGKTRLALQVGNTLLHDFSDGVFFCDLAPLTDPGLVPAVIARVLSVTEEVGTDMTQTLIRFLRETHLLLVLDNFEHLLAGSSVVASLLDECRHLRILVTSRIPLHLSREHEHAVPPLTVPDPHHVSDASALSQYESVALFIQRAKAAKESFAVTDEIAPAVAEICIRLDGLPLAIELAAARTKLFPPQALLHRLASRLKLLTGGATDRPSRQQTLRGAIDWSYSLLTDEERTLFARLSVFVGGCTFEAAEAVCNPEEELDLLEGLASLVDKSLLQQVGEEEPRFTMLETIREYAGERLTERGEAERSHARHAAYFTELAEAAELRGAHHVVWVQRLDQELENLRAALGRNLASDHELGLRLAGALSGFWEARGYWSEGRRWLEALLAGGGESASARAQALHSAGTLAWRQDDYARASALLQESVQLRRELKDTLGTANSLLILAHVARLQNDLDWANNLYEECIRLGQELGDLALTGSACSNLGGVAALQGDVTRAKELRDEGLRLRREAGDTRGIALSLMAIGYDAALQGDYERAREVLPESLQLAREISDTPTIGVALRCLGAVTSWLGDVERAEELLEESLRLNRELGDRLEIANCLGQLVQMAVRRGEYQQAAILGEEALELGREVGNPGMRAMHLFGLGFAVLGQGDEERAQALEEESLRLFQQMGDRFGMSNGLTGLAAVAGFRGDHERATQLLEAAYANWNVMGVARDPCFAPTLHEVSRVGHDALGERAYLAAARRGNAMSLEEAVVYALNENSRKA